MRQLNGSVYLAILFALIAGLVLFLSFDLGMVARKVPLIVAVPTFILLLCQAAVDTVSGTGQPHPSAPYFPHERNASPEAQGASAGPPSGSAEQRLLLEASALAAAVYLIGMYSALSCYVLFRLRFVSREKWGVAVSAALAVAAASFVFLQIMLKLPPHWGWLLPLLSPFFQG